MMNFAAIDFETANNRRSSACSVAIVEIKDGIITDSYYTLIRPPQMDFSYFNIQIHGIRPEDVREQPTFAEVWPELRQRLAGRIVVAHNAQFDMSVLRSCLKEYDLGKPKFSHCCTVIIARKVWPELENHKLDTVGNYLQLAFNHHNALDDARTCAAIPLLAGKKLQVDNFASLALNTGVMVKPFE